jgi:membrane-associated HD superfamily phosphohydrolase
MHGTIVSSGLQYLGYLIEAGLVCYLVWRSKWKSLRAVTFYLASFLAAELIRASVLNRYGLTSRQYLYVYWSTDFLLLISAFVLVCLFFRRACRNEEKMWRFARLLLALVFVLVVGISSLCFSRNYSNLLAHFIVEFNQNLYFTCLVLNTLLYLLLQYTESTDDQLQLLVCGVGIQYAGPAAALALVHLTTGQGFAKSLFYFTIPLCTLGMLLVWAYAIIHVKDNVIKVTRREIPALAEVTANLNI